MSAPHCDVPNTDTAGTVGIMQVARWAGAAFGRFPAANSGSSSVAPVLRPRYAAGKPYAGCAVR